MIIKYIKYLNKINISLIIEIFKNNINYILKINAKKSRFININ